MTVDTYLDANLSPANTNGHEYDYDYTLDDVRQIARDAFNAGVEEGIYRAQDTLVKVKALKDFSFINNTGSRLLRVKGGRK